MVIFYYGNVMSRQLLIKIHLYLASFMAPVLVIIAISGGLYLFGFKGSNAHELVYQGAPKEINTQAQDMKTEINRLFKKLGIESDFDYVRKSGTAFITRPTSRDFYVISVNVEDQAKGLEVEHYSPDFVKTIVELHKGHGPSLFKSYQKLVAIGLVFILLSGLWLGLTSPKLRNVTIVLASSGTAVLLLLILM